MEKKKITWRNTEKCWRKMSLRENLISWNIIKFHGEIPPAFLQEILQLIMGKKMKSGCFISQALYIVSDFEVQKLSLMYIHVIYHVFSGCCSINIHCHSCAHNSGNTRVCHHPVHSDNWPHNPHISNETIDCSHSPYNHTLHYFLRHRILLL